MDMVISMSKHQHYEELNNFKDGVIRELVYWNTIGFFLLFLCEGMILYALVQILAPFTVLYNHVWTLGILTCVVILALTYLNATEIDKLMTARGRIKLSFIYDVDRHFAVIVRLLISFLTIYAAYRGVECIIEAILTIVSFAIVMEILLSIILVGGVILFVLYIVVDWLVSARRDENWWCDEMEELFKAKTADDAVKDLIKENKGVIAGQYDR